MSNKALIIIILIVIVIAGIWFWTSSFKNNLNIAGSEAPTTTKNATTAPAILSFTVERPDFVVHGTDLSRVEIWVVPTGTGITEADYQKLGDAALSGTDTNGIKTWTLAIPQEEFLATDILARGFDENGETLSDVSLGITGATEIHDELWGTASSSGEISQ